MSQTDLSAYRPNVGVVLFNTAGQVWLGRRANTPEPWNWQFPQGGVDEGEDLEAAALRELLGARERAIALGPELAAPLADAAYRDFILRWRVAIGRG